MNRLIVKVNVDEKFEAWTTLQCRKAIYLGCGENNIKILSELGYNEFIITNLARSLTKSILDGLETVVRISNLPIAYSGNVRPKDIPMLRAVGVDRVFLGSHRFNDTILVDQCCSIFGVQSLGGSIIYNSETFEVQTSENQFVSNDISVEFEKLKADPRVSEILLHSWLGDGRESEMAEGDELAYQLSDVSMSDVNVIGYGSTCFPAGVIRIVSRDAVTLGEAPLIRPADGIV